MKGKVFLVYEHFSTEIVGSVPMRDWAFSGGLLNVNWKMLPAVWPEHQKLTVPAKKNKGNYYRHYNIILIQPPLAMKRQPHELNEIKEECASNAAGDPRPKK